MARYFDLARTVVERHGGTVEKFIGDAVMAVFGVPVLHEDDALRAVRAAADLRTGLAELNGSLERDYGTSSSCESASTRARWSPGRRAARNRRCRQHCRPPRAGGAARRDPARPGDVDARQGRGLRRGGGAARAEGEGRGPHRVPARLGVGDRPVSPPRVGDGRAHAGARAASCGDGPGGHGRSCQLFTVLGAAGVGKSRLSHEFLDGLDEATVVRGTCLSYGEGITYWPVVEILKQLLGAEPERRLAELGLDRGAARPLQAVLGEGDLQTSARRSPGQCGDCSRPRRAARLSSPSSTTFTGARTRSSTSSITSPT